MRSLLLSLIVLCSFAANAQDYVVTIQKDTLYGEVEVLLPDEFYEEVSISVNGDKQRIKSYQLLEVFSDSSIYHPAKIQNKYRLLKLIEGGYLSLYLYRADQTYDFNTYYLLKSTTEGMIVPNISFRKRVTEFLSDCDEVVTKLDDKTYKKNDLVEIIKDYNICLEKYTQNKFDNSAPVLQEEDRSALALITSIEHKIKSEGNDELETLLGDIKQKVKSGSTVPSYLISALKEQTSALEGLKEEVDQLLQALSK